MSQNSWVHDGDVERSAADIVVLAGQARESAAAAEASAEEAQSVVDAALDDIGAAKVSAVAEVTGTKETAVSAVETAEYGALSGISSARLSAISDVQSAGSSAIASVETQGTTSVSAVAAQQETSVSAVAAQQETSVAAVEAAGEGAIEEISPYVTQAIAAKDAAETAQSGAETAETGAEAALALVLAETANLVHKSGAETISGTKTFSAGLMGTAAAASTTISPTSGTILTKTISANTTFTFGSSSGTGDAACITLILTNGGAYTVTWPNNLKWAGGEAPDLTASGVDILTFMTADSGATWYGFLNGAGMA